MFLFHAVHTMCKLIIYTNMPLLYKISVLFYEQDKWQVIFKLHKNVL